MNFIEVGQSTELRSQIADALHRCDRRLSSRPTRRRRPWALRFGLSQQGPRWPRSLCRNIFFSAPLTRIQRSSRHGASHPIGTGNLAAACRWYRAPPVGDITRSMRTQLPSGEGRQALLRVQRQFGCCLRCSECLLHLRRSARGLDHGVDNKWVTSHSKVVVGAPYHDFVLVAAVTPPCIGWPGGMSLNICEDAVTALSANAVEYA